MSPAGVARSRVTVVLFGPYAALLPEECAGRAELDMPHGATVEAVLEVLGVPPEGRTFVTLNGRRVPPQTELDPDSEVRVVVPLGGG